MVNFFIRNLKFYNVVLILFLTSINFNYSQSYKIEREGKLQGSNFYSLRHSIEIRKMPKGTYSENSFYIKANQFTTENDIEKFIKISLGEKGYPDLQISEITRPFQKYQPNNLLRNQNSRLENVFLIEIENKFEIFDLCSLLTETNEFEYAVPVIFYQLNEFRPNDSSLDKQWYLESVDLFRAWDIGKGDGTVTIAIVDSGTDFEHEELKQQVWTNLAEIPDDGIDNDGNGFIDDVHGWDFVGDISHSDAIQDKFLEDNNVIPALQSNDHGTHVAGTAAAKSNNAKGIASTGYDVKFMPVKIGVDDLNKSRMVYRPYEAMLYAAANGADVINCSWSSGIHDPLALDVVIQLLDMGVFIVAAAGNENSFFDFYPYYPAVIPGVIAVGSCSQNNTKSSSSNFGVNVTCFAPGENIYAPINNNRYIIKSGTSMASPIVAGIVSTMKLIFPNYSYKQIRKQIRATVSPINPKTYLTHGKINAFDAFRYNNPAYPAYKTPGIGIEEILIEGSDAINSYGETNLKIKLKNYLSDAVNITVNISPQDNYFDVTPAIANIQNLKANETYDLDVKFILNQSCPWYSGDAYLFIRYESGNYSDNDLVSIPIRLETNNRFLFIHNFLEDVEIDWFASVATGNFDFWTVGYDYGTRKGVMYNFGKLNRLSTPTDDVIFDISALDDRNIMLAANGKEKATKVMNSTNSGASFTSTVTTPMLSSLMGVKMYDIDNCIAYGKDSQGLGKIIFSTDGGQSFSNSGYNFTFSSLPNEHISSKLVERNNISYIGTSAGKIIRSSDLGRTWVLYSERFIENIVQIAVINDDSLFVIIENNENYSLYVTKDGKGFSKANYTITELKNSLKMFVPDSSNTVYLMDKSGKIYYSSDMGTTWNAELSSMYPFYDLHTAALFSKSGKARLWMAGADINYLDFDVIPANVVRDVRIAGMQNIKFDTTNIFEFQEEIIFLENKGNIRSYINGQSLSVGTDFEISELFKSAISPSELISATIKYKPQSTGFHYDTLSITTDADDEPLKFIISGFSVDPLSVNSDAIINDDFKLINQSSGNFMLEITAEKIVNYEIKLFDINGKLVNDFGQVNHNGNISYLKISTEYLPQGVYIFEIRSGTNINVLKLPVIRN